MENDKTLQPRPIDWEQRRYEIARDIYPVICHHMDPRACKTAPTKASVELADILIEELQRKRP